MHGMCWLCSLCWLCTEISFHKLWMVLNVFCLFFLLHAQFGVFTSEGHQPFTKLHSHVSCAQFASHMERPFKEQRRSARHAALCAPFFLSSNFFLGKTGSTEVRVVYDFMIFVAHPLRLKKSEVNSSQYISPETSFHASRKKHWVFSKHIMPFNPIWWSWNGINLYLSQSWMHPWMVQLQGKSQVQRMALSFGW